MYISVPALSSEYMQSVSIDVVANFFSIPLERDEELSTGIYIAKPVRVRHDREIRVPSVPLTHCACDRVRVGTAQAACADDPPSAERVRPEARRAWFRGLWRVCRREPPQRYAFELFLRQSDLSKLMRTYVQTNHRRRVLRTWSSSSSPSSQRLMTTRVCAATTSTSSSARSSCLRVCTGASRSVAWRA